MKVLSLSFLMVTGLFAQATAPPATRPAPGTMQTSPGTAAPGAEQKPTTGPTTPVSPDTVVAKVGGKDYTAAEIDKMLSDFPPQVQQAIARQPQLLSNFFMFRTLAQQAEFQNLDKEPRYRQELAYQRMTVLAQAEINHYRESIQIKPEDEKAYYEQNKNQYRTATVKAIYVKFTPAPKGPAAAATPATPAAADSRTEAEAKAKIDDLRKQILAGADFAKLATEQSDDKISAAKGGDYGEVSMTGNYPQKVKEAIFKLKAGEVSEPVQETGGFYLFKVVDMTVQPFEKVSGQVLQQMQQGDFQAWIAGLQARNKVTIENPGWFAVRNAR
ncbi:MAG TPA: peptidylprolyl isomerase [Bryobacteraceae bacterium]|nr:peptidylprolyl isomerase [Bryobacteraceae bacterium]